MVPLQFSTNSTTVPKPPSGMPTPSPSSDYQSCKGTTRNPMPNVLFAEVLSNSDFSPLILYFAIYFIANESSCTYGSLFKVHGCLCSCRKTNLLKCQRRSEDYKVDGSIPRSRPVTLTRTSR